MKHLIAGTLVLLAGSPSGCADLRTQPVDYTADGEVMKGYLAYDARIKGKRPGVLVVPEWWGQNEYARRRARMLAELGYTALAVDMYGGGRQAANPEEARKLAGEVMNNPALGRARFTAVLDLLRRQPTVDPERVAAIGYCFGGGVVLQMAREGLPLTGVVSFHGGLSTTRPAQPGVVKAKILVLHGADDKVVPPAQVEAFKEEMRVAGVDYRFIAYPGAQHSFTNSDADGYARKFNLPIGYNAEADRESWAEMQRFFKTIFAD